MAAETSVEIANERGLHARASAKFVKLAATFDAEVTVTKDGATEVRSADLDETGAFGDWPEDFADVTLEAQARYLDAAERRLARAKR